MSGGRFDYKQHILNDIAEEIEEIIKNNGIKDEDGYSYNYSKLTIAEFNDTIRLLKKAEIYVQRIDWLVSGDDGEDTFHKRLEEDLGLRK